MYFVKYWRWSFEHQKFDWCYHQSTHRQILALQGDAGKIGQTVGEASGELVADLAISATTAGIGKVAVQSIKTINKVDGDAIAPNAPNNSNDVMNANVQVGDWGLGNVYNR